ncbi:MAG: LPS export ABC transporter periplasmic protein LptC [Croceibacterium sp.]
MSRQADQIRTRRQRFAAPGGSFDRLVRLLAIGLPALVGGVAATMLIAPLKPRGEISFVLDRNKVAIANDRLRVAEAVYRGVDKKGRPFALSAGNAVQMRASEPIVRMDDVTARLQMSDGPAVLSAANGSYNIQSEQIAIPGAVNFAAADGYRMTANGVSVDLPGRRVHGSRGVSGAIPAGTFSADTISADLDARVLTLAGHARLRMVPGRMRMP